MGAAGTHELYMQLEFQFFYCGDGIHNYLKQRILFYHKQGRKARRIRNLLLNEGIRASDVVIYKFLLRVAKTGCISRRPGSGQDYA